MKRTRLGQTTTATHNAGRALSRGDEASLRNRLHARDEQALAELIDLASPWLLGVAFAILHDQDDAEDVVLESLRSAWLHVQPTTAESERLLPWLLRITRHRAIDRLRARRRSMTRHLRARGLGVLSGDGIPPVEPNEAATPGWHVHAAVHAALGELPPERQVLVRLAFFHGLSHSEIAERLEVPVGTVKTRLRAAYAQLRETLAPLKGWLT